ncbi:MAG TPA: translation initiation factor IF-2, partial [Terriglobus sp.]
MSKVRINDLARELEVKSKEILDALTAVGVTEKKTHSSSIEDDEADKVRRHLTGGRAPSRPQVAEPKKIDLSAARKPGDIQRMLAERRQAEQAAAAAPVKPAVASAPPKQPVVAVVAPPKPTAPPAPAPTPAPPVVVAAPAAPVVSEPVEKAAPAPVAEKPVVVVRPAAPPPAPAAPAVAPSRPPITRPVMPTLKIAQPRTEASTPDAPRRTIMPQARQAPVIVNPAPRTGPAIASRPPQGVVVRPGQPAGDRPAIAGGTPPPQGVVVARPPATAPAPAAPVAATPAPAVPEAPAPAAPAAPEEPKRRVIMPQTGPRPSYTAPAQVPGMPPRRPIFQRPGGPGGPGAGGPGGSRPPYGGPGGGPGARRPMHPTRTFPGGPPTGPGGRPGFGQRPGFGGPGGRPGFGGPRPGAPGLIAEGTPGSAKPGMRPAAKKGAANKKRYEKSKEGPMKGFAPPSRFGGAQIAMGDQPITRTITVTEGVTVKDLAEALGLRGKDLIATLLMRGVFVTVNQSLDNELVKSVAAAYGADAQVQTVEEQLENEAIEGVLTDTSGMTEIVRPPVVTVMGHVDHGKTSLLDAIRSTDVASGEAGGITQHIGAYKVHVTKEDSPAYGREIVFLDTPGHEAFTRMRARGAKVTDIVVIVVAADDGVMPQTIEAIDHARAAKVPIIVAINKIDKPGADSNKVKGQLAERGLQLVGWGGDVEFVEVSAKQRINLDGLEEMICLVADTNAQKAIPERPAVGTVIEAKLDRGRGAVASILVQNGTLKVGDSYIVGNTFGKIRAMFDDRGRSIEAAGPSTPVEILGLESIPDAGDTFIVMADRDRAKEIARYRTLKEREAQLAKSSRVSLEGLAEQIKQAGVKDLNLVLKGDVQGSVQVLIDSLQRMSTEKVRVRVLHSGV